MFLPTGGILRILLDPIRGLIWPFRILYLGVGVLLFGLIFYLVAQPIQPVVIKGTLAEATDYSHSQDGPYAYTGITLHEDPREFRINLHYLIPTFSQKLKLNAAITIWYNNGTTDIVGMTLGNATSQATPQYTTYDWSHRTYKADSQHGLATIVMGGGVVLIAAGLILLWYPRRKKPPSIAQNNPTNATVAPNGATP